MSNETALELIDELERDYLDKEKEVEWLEGKMDLEFGI